MFFPSLTVALGKLSKVIACQTLQITPQGVSFKTWQSVPKQTKANNGQNNNNNNTN